MHYALIPLVLGAAVSAKPVPRSSSIPVSGNTVPFVARVPVSRGRKQLRQERLNHVRSLAGAKAVSTVELNAPGGADE